MKNTNTLKINGIDVKIGEEKNLLELIRRTGIDLPTFCYHSDLSVYGACRLCIVDIEGMGIVASCSTAPKEGMVVRTETKEIRGIRKTIIELLLANHKRECPTCVRSSSCTLQDLGRRLGVEDICFKQTSKFRDVDLSNSLARDPSKCVLCGDCVRICNEVQGIGAINFAGRGSGAHISTVFGKRIGDVECVNCGQCAKVCPTGAIIPRQHRDEVWNDLLNEDKMVVAQVAPAVRVALGEYFGMKPGVNIAGKLVTALKLMGFKYVCDTSYSADMTVWEESNELIQRVVGDGGKLPLFTSCCPAWVRYCEVYYPEFVPNLSTCKSPQQMFGSVAKDFLAMKEGVQNKDVSVISIMPCTAKKDEAQLEKMSHNGIKEVDYVLTTVELARMIRSMGIRFEDLEENAFDMPFGFASGSGKLFGNGGGVTEAALRYSSILLNGNDVGAIEYESVNNDLCRIAEVKLGEKNLKVAVVSGLAKTKKLIEMIKANEIDVDFVEVMSCVGGCIAGAGQPFSNDNQVVEKRTAGLRNIDKKSQISNSNDNFFVKEYYDKFLDGRPGSGKAHHRLHTKHNDLSEILNRKLNVHQGTKENLLNIEISVAVSKKAAHGGNILLKNVIDMVNEMQIEDAVNINAVLSSDDNVVNVKVGDTREIFDMTDKDNISTAVGYIKEQIKNQPQLN